MSEVDEPQTTKDRLVQKLMSAHKDKIELFQAESRVRGILEQTPAQIVRDIHEALLSELPSEQDGRPVGYVLTYLKVNIRTDEDGYPSSGELMMNYFLGQSLLIPQRVPHNPSIKWAVAGSSDFIINLAASMFTPRTPLDRIYLAAFQYDERVFPLMTSPIFEGAGIPPSRVYMWNIHDGWLWEGEDVIDNFLGAPLEIGFPLVVGIDKRKQRRLSMTFKVESILSQILESLPDGHHSLINMVQTTKETCHMEVIKENGEVLSLGPLATSRNVLLSQIAQVLDVERERGMLSVFSDSLDGTQSFVGWRYDKKGGFEGVSPERMRLYVTTFQEFGLAPTTAECSFPEPFEISIPDPSAS